MLVEHCCTAALLHFPANFKADARAEMRATQLRRGGRRSQHHKTGHVEDTQPEASRKQPQAARKVMVDTWCWIL